MQRIYGWSRILETGEPAPSCSVTVYDTGTLNLATIYADNILTPKANPFTADATSGYWFFYAASSGRYDVRFSGGGIVTPYTIGDVSTAGLLTLNGLTADTQTFATGSAGTDFAISSAGSTHTFNIPSASAANRGLVTTGAQTFAGAKTFSTPIAATSGGTGLGTAPSADGQLLIGAAAGTYALATLTPVANQTTVSNGAGTVTVGTVQAIGTGSSPTFAGLTLSGLTANAFVYAGASGVIAGTAAATDGQVLIGRTGNVPLAATLTAGTGVVITNGAGTITISSTGSISSLNGLSASSQSFATGTSGSDFNISSVTSTHTFNIPDASGANRGLITTGTQTIAGAKTLTGAFVASSTTAASFGAQPTATVGTGSDTATIGGRFYVNTTTVGNLAGGEDDLMSCTIAANTFNADGRTVVFKAAGTGANNANAKVWQFRLDGTSILATGNFTNEAVTGWDAEITIVRKSATTAACTVRWQCYAVGVGSGVRNGYVLVTVADWTSARIFKVTGQAVADNDIVQQLMVGLVF